MRTIRALGLVGARGRIGHRAGDRRHVSGLVPQVTMRRDLGRIEHDLLVVDAPSSDGKVRHTATALPTPRLRRIRPPSYSRRWSRPARSGRRARRPRSTCCTRSCGLPCDSERIASPAYSITWPVPPAVPILPMIARITSFAVTPGGSTPSTRTSMFFAGRCSRCLRRQNMLHFRGADAEGQRAHRAMGGGVRIAANDGHARQGNPLLRPHDMHNALTRIQQRKIGNPELRHIALERFDLQPASGSAIPNERSLVGTL